LKRATAEALLREMDRARIDRAIVMGLPWRSPELCRRTNAYIASAVRRNPKRLVGLGVLPPPKMCRARDGIKRMVDEHGFRGVKVIPSWQGYRLDSRECAPCLEQIAARKLVLMPHTDHVFVDPSQGDPACALFEVARRYPELRILAPHLGGLLCLYALHRPVKPVLKNILFITTVPTTMRMISFALGAVGERQLAFGTDFPFNPSHDQRAVRRAFEALPMSAKTRRLIAGENVARFLDGKAE